MAKEEYKKHKWLLWVVISLIVIVGLVVVGFLLRSSSEKLDSAQSPLESEVLVRIGEATQAVEKVGSNEAELSVTIEGTEELPACLKSLYEDMDAYDYWEERFTATFPDLDVYDAGAYCELEDGTKLVSFSYFYDNELDPGAGQMVVLFDQANQLLKSTDDFVCPTLGDVGYPKFDSIESDILNMYCGVLDPASPYHVKYKLNLDTFNVTEIGRSAGETIVVDKITSLTCIDSGQGEPCDANWLQLEIDLTEDFDGESFTGDFYLRVYNKFGMIGEERIIPNWSPFAGDGGNGLVNDDSDPMTIEVSLTSNFSVVYLDIVPRMESIGPAYQLTLNDVDNKATQSGRAFRLISSQGHISISFLQ